MSASSNGSSFPCEELHRWLVFGEGALHTGGAAGQAGYAVTTTSGGALLLEAVVPQLAVVLLSLPLKSCGWDLTDVSSARVTAKSSRRPPRGSSAGKAFELFDALASGVVKHRHVAVLEGEVAGSFFLLSSLKPF